MNNLLDYGEFICYCAKCRTPITKAMMDRKEIVDNPVYKCGELQYYELAHEMCIPEWKKEN